MTAKATRVLVTIAATPSLPAAPTPEVHAAPRAPGAHPFAELLRQNQAAAVEAAPRAPAASADAEAPEAGAATKPPQAQKTKPRAGAGPASQRPTQGAPGAKGEAVSADAKPAPPGADSTPAQPDPALVQWLADLRLPRDAKAQPGGTEANTDAEAGASAALGRGRAGKAFDAANGSDPTLAPQDAPDKGGPARGNAAALLLQEQIAGAAADKTQGPRAAEGGTNRIESMPGAAALAASFGPAGTPSAALSTPVDISLATPLGAPEFAQALGIQVSVLARDGIHRAELHLNPADMGPVSVQIVVDGTQARVDFGADLAATRQAIEAGLPELASALRDAGLTLHGGGVSQHSRGRGEAGEGGAHGNAANGVQVAETEALRPRRIAVPGGVDLYA